jgi:DNA-binding NarL/FixJ family response regulator
MPVMNGLEAAQKIGSIAPKTAMVLFTMHSSDHLVKDAQEVGIRDVISSWNAACYDREHRQQTARSNKINLQ